MTAPRNTLVHPHRRRGRHVLPLIVALCGPLACSNDQTAPTPATGGSGTAATVSHPVPKPAGSRISVSSGAPYRVYPSLSSRAGAPALLVEGPSVLVLADTDIVSTNALTTSLANAGAQVTVRPGPEYLWDGTNPSLEGFDVVVHLNGSSYEAGLDDAGQSALSSFVSNGGGYVGANWNGQEYQPLMADLVLQTFGGNPAGPEQTCGFCQITYETDAAGAGHPVLAGLPAAFTFTADGHDAGPQVQFAGNPSSVLMRVPSGGAAVLVRQLGTGRIVNFSFAPNYYFDDMGAVQDPVTLQDAHIRQLYVNAVNWASGLGSGTAESQSITFGPLGGKVFGDADFAISASASSGLPVNFTSTGGCTVLGTMVSITAAGSCTITAHQAGNDEYLAAEDVSQSFQIQRATQTITFNSPLPGKLFGDAAFSISAVASSGLPVSFTASGGCTVLGTTVSITAAGSCTITAHQAGNAAFLPAHNVTRSFQIQQAVPSIHWSPAALLSGTPLGPSQLNATATGVGGAPISGTFVYTPSAGTSFGAGTVTLSTQFTPASSNYTGAARSISITVSGTMNFAGFYAPLKNLPYVNTVMAGSAIPVKFSLGAYRGINVLQGGAPTSTAVDCPAGAPSNPVRPGIAGSSGLKAVGSTYSYVWRTSPSWGGTCRRLILTLADGSTHEALFRFAAAAPATTSSTARRLLGR